MPPPPPYPQIRAWMSAFPLAHLLVVQGWKCELLAEEGLMKEG